MAGYNGVWRVKTVLDSSRFQADLRPTQGLQAGTGGTAGDSSLSCGQPHGMLTYDTAAYWFPSAYLSGVPVAPERIRAYYFGPALHHPKGLQLIGGKSDAPDAASNKHVHWHCGQSEALPTPSLSHPYDCAPYRDLPSGDFVDGIVGVVEMPRCWDGYEGLAPDAPIGPSHVKYPDEDGGVSDTTCEPPYDEELIKLSLRDHFGGTLMTPCTTCLAYNLARTEIVSGTCSGGLCQGKFTIANFPSHGLSVGDFVDVTGAKEGWDSPAAGYQIVSKNATTFRVANLPSTLATCTQRCGAASQHYYNVTFTLAGPGPEDTGNPYYRLHADFYQTWQQAALIALEDKCANGGVCAQDGQSSNIKDNAQVDNLPAP
ncbi:MAG: DUF1996 domain-containing protein [Actinobacteria bacterium]|nr:DUF1996 domain-containing protein [Actinomycetota bacterium]